MGGGVLGKLLSSGADDVVRKSPSIMNNGRVNMTPDDLNMFKIDIGNALSDWGIDGVDIDSLYHIGSTRKGVARPDSDVDMVLRYRGDEREDNMFNAIQDYIESNGLDFDGRPVDINPIPYEDFDQYKQLLTDAGALSDDPLIDVISNGRIAGFDEPTMRDLYREASSVGYNQDRSRFIGAKAPVFSDDQILQAIWDIANGKVQ